MQLFRRIREGVLKLRATCDRKTPVLRLQVSNRSRQTILADCAEVAGNGARRRKGLLGRESLAPGQGLWIVPCEAVHTFGMRFPIDIVYLDRSKRIMKVKTGLPAWRLSACLLAHSVIELPSGTVRRTQSAPGDILEFSSSASAVGSGEYGKSVDCNAVTATVSRINTFAFACYLCC